MHFPLLLTDHLQFFKLLVQLLPLLTNSLHILYFQLVEVASSLRIVILAKCFNEIVAAL